jgi:FkbM family methyltransferase
MTNNTDNSVAVTTMLLQLPNSQIEFVLFNNSSSRLISKNILSGQTYELVPFVNHVLTIIDVGANIGAASAFFAFHYPAATVHAVEPNPKCHPLLLKNAEQFPNISVHTIGLHSATGERALYSGRTDTVESSIHPSPRTSDSSSMLPFQSVEQFLQALQVTQIDILKVDTEGCEVQIMQGFGLAVARIQVIYVEYHSESDRLTLDKLLSTSHILYRGKICRPFRGEFCYVNRKLFEQHPDETTYELT